MTRQRRPLELERVDLTPMIDVTFLLLIFFICTLSFRVLEGRLDSHLPKDRGPNHGPVTDLMEPLDVHLRRDASAPEGLRIIAGNRIVPGAAALAPLIRQARAVQPDLCVELHVEGGVRHGQVVTVVDALLASGQTDILFAANG